MLKGKSQLLGQAHPGIATKTQVLLFRRFAPEADYGANAGLKVGRDLLEKVKKDYPWISYADLWTLAGAVAIEDMGGEIRTSELACCQGDF